MALRVQVVFDCRDPDGLSRFYEDALHYKLQNPPEGFESWEGALKAWDVPEEDWNSASAIVDPEGRGPRIYFQRMDTPKLGKNRVHLDLNASAGSRATLQERKAQVRAEVERLIKRGAKEQREWEERGEYWVVMLDPEGNEFCVQ
jgi:Glyoxalase-like domain